MGTPRPRQSRLCHHCRADVSDGEVRARPRARVYAGGRGRHADDIRSRTGEARGGGAHGVTATTSSPDPAATFEPHRRRLLGLAYRMLGSMADAEDAVQEAYLRWHAA